MNDTNKRETEATPPSSATIYPIWLGFAEKRSTGRGTLRIHLRWARIMAFLFVLGIMSWIGKSVAFYYFFSEVRDFEEVTFQDMLMFPINRSSIRIQQGDYQVRQGMEALERKDYRRAFSLLREGVTRSPENTEGRLTLSRLYAGWRPDLAVDLMVEGLETGKENNDYVNLLCALLLQQKMDEKLLEVSEELLAEELPKEVLQTLAASRLSVAIARGKFALAQDVFETTEIKQSLDGILLGADLYTRIGQPETAIGILKSVIAAFPNEKLEPVYRKLISVYRSNGELEKAREVALELSIKDPMEWQPRIILVDLLSESKKDARRDREIEAILRQHRNDEEAMLALGQICANQGNMATASRLYELALENDFNLGMFSLMLIESYVNGKAFDRAIALSNELVREDPDWLGDLESTFNGVRSLAYFGSGNSELGSLYLKNFRTSRQTTIGQLFQASNSYQKFGFNDEALSLLNEAFKRDSSNEQVLAGLIDLQMELGNSFELANHIRDLFELRRPSYKIIDNIRTRLTSDRFIFTENRQDLLTSLKTLSDEPVGINIEIWTKDSEKAAEAIAEEVGS